MSAKDPRTVPYFSDQDYAPLRFECNLLSQPSNSTSDQGDKNKKYALRLVLTINKRDRYDQIVETLTLAAGDAQTGAGGPVSCSIPGFGGAQTHSSLMRVGIWLRVEWAHNINDAARVVEKKVERRELSLIDEAEDGEEGSSDEDSEDDFEDGDAATPLAPTLADPLDLMAPELAPEPAPESHRQTAPHLSRSSTMPVGGGMMEPESGLDLVRSASERIELGRTTSGRDLGDIISISSRSGANISRARSERMGMKVNPPKKSVPILGLKPWDASRAKSAPMHLDLQISKELSTLDWSPGPNGPRRPLPGASSAPTGGWRLGAEPEPEQEAEPGKAAASERWLSARDHVMARVACVSDGADAFDPDLRSRSPSPRGGREPVRQLWRDAAGVD